MMEKLIPEFLVRSILIALCTAAALFLFRVRAARVRHTVWTGVMLSMLILPGWTVWGPKAVLHVLTPPKTAVIPTQVATHVETLSDVSSMSVSEPSRSFENVLFAVYLFGFAVLSIRLLSGTIRTRILMSRAQNRAGRLTSDACVTPITAGWLRPSVILPANWTQWSEAELNAVLAHENEHARRHDPLVQWLALLNRALFWFHPLAWWLEKRLSGLSEEACDDAVLMRGHDPLEYSEYLLRLARAVQQSGARVEVVGMAMPGTFLPERIRRIVGGEKVQRISRGRLVWMGMFCATVSMVCVVGSIGYSATPQTQTESRALPQPAAAETTTPKPIIPMRKAPQRVLIAQAVAPSSAPSIFGTIVDPSNSVVVGTSVVLTNLDTNDSLTTTTGKTGEFQFAGAPSGTYSLTVKTPGFKALTQTGIRITAGEPRNVGRMFLQLGSISESVSVFGQRSASQQSFVGTLGAITTVPVTPPARPATPAKQPIGEVITDANHAGGKVSPANVILAVKPVYPVEPLARGVAGTVRIEAVVSKEGTLSGMRVTSSPDSSLSQAALDALSQWRYRPTLLNDQPVEVVTAIDVNYSLKD